MDAATRMLPAPGRFRNSPTDPHLTGLPGRPAGLQNQETGFLDHRRELFETRVAQHKIRDGHGDLRSDYVYFEPGGLQIIDCIEFNERFRCGDVACNRAFLCMDLEYLFVGNGLNMI